MSKVPKINDGAAALGETALLRGVDCNEARDWITRRASGDELRQMARGFLGWDPETFAEVRAQLEELLALAWAGRRTRTTVSSRPSRSTARPGRARAAAGR